MSSIRNITVTDARLREAVQGVANNSKSNGGSITQSISCTLFEANVIKWYVGIDKAIIQVNNEEVEASINYPFINKEFIISALPQGDVSDDGTYIQPRDTVAHVLQYEKKYLVLGFKQAESTKTSDVGEILLQAGDNCINICPDFVNISANALFINGKRYE